MKIKIFGVEVEFEDEPIGTSSKFALESDGIVWIEYQPINEDNVSRLRQLMKAVCPGFVWMMDVSSSIEMKISIDDMKNVSIDQTRIVYAMAGRKFIAWELGYVESVSLELMARAKHYVLNNLSSEVENYVFHREQEYRQLTNLDHSHDRI